MAMSGTEMTGTFVFLLFSGRCLPDGDHDDECAVLLFLFFLLCSGRYYLTVVMAISALYVVFLLRAGVCEVLMRNEV